jgi:glycine hydroxymethyltransferase
MVTSGRRMGTPAITTRGFREAEAEQVSHWIADVLAAPADEATLKRVQSAVIDLCRRFPVYA